MGSGNEANAKLQVRVGGVGWQALVLNGLNDVHIQTFDIACSV